MSSAPYDPSASDETQKQRLARKSREAPFMPLGLAGLAVALIYGAYKYRHRGSMSTSVYLMQLRVGAQGMVVGALGAGIGYTLFRDYVWPDKDDKK